MRILVAMGGSPGNSRFHPQMLMKSGGIPPAGVLLGYVREINKVGELKRVMLLCRKNRNLHF